MQIRSDMCGIERVLNENERVLEGFERSYVQPVVVAASDVNPSSERFLHEMNDLNENELGFGPLAVGKYDG